MKQIKLSNSDQWLMVDDEDFDRVSKYKWAITGTGKGRVKRSQNIPATLTEKRKTLNVSISNEVMNRLGILFDHKDRNPLNNQKSNLREATYRQNAMNQSKQKGTTSTYYGVAFHKRDLIFCAQIASRRNKIHLGNFKYEIDAARAYDKKAKELFGEFAHLNFP